MCRVETIYQAVYSGTLGVKPTECLRTRRPGRKCRQARHPNKRTGLPNISLRPVDVEDRSEVGHWEIDQIIGARNQSSLLTFAERVTRYTMAITMPDGYNSEATLAGLIEGLGRVPGHLLKSVTSIKDRSGLNGRLSPVFSTLMCGSVTRTRHGNAGRSRTRTGPGGSGSPEEPASISSTKPTSILLHQQSMGNVDGTSTTNALQPSTIKQSCNDH